MTAQQLKNSILQMAVQGKLVPQDPNDEPASVLLERIRAEKERLIKEKKIKKEKNPSIIFKGGDNTPYEKIGDEVRSLEDEVPFDIPDSWEWVRLSQIALVLNGDRGKNYPSKEKLVSSGIPFISALNLDGRTVVKDGNLLCVTEAQYNLLANGKLKKGDIVVCIRGSLGKHAKYPFEKGAIASSLVILRTLSNEETLADYIMMWLDSPLFFSEIRKYDNGTAQPNLAAKSLEQFFVPIPPLGEQRHIVEKINEVTSAVSAYDVAYQRNETLNSTFPEFLKKSILQEAVQGKLIPQDPSDEPAEVLLERILAEKQRLIKEGKIKKDKHESVIFRRDNSHYEKLDGVERCIDDELPFEIPENWCWCKIGTIFTLQAGKNIQAVEIHENPFADSYPCYGGNGIRGYVASSNRTGDYPIIGRQGALCGNINRATGEFYATEHAVCVETYSQISVAWACLFLTALNLNQYATATAQPGLAVANINEVYIPLPPLAEQHRIVQRIEKLLPLVKGL